MSNICINCVYFFDAGNPKESIDGTYGSRDVCKADKAPVTNFVRFDKQPSVINATGECPHYLSKSKLEVVDGAKI
jgi:hypothetical protein